jgi:hypothetical protein
MEIAACRDIARHLVSLQTQMTYTWYYADKEQAVGPLILADLIFELQKFQNWHDAPVWRQGFGAWQRAREVEEISALTMPPPIPRDGVSCSPLDLSHELKKSKPWTIAKTLGGLAVLAAAVIGGAFGNAITKSAYEFATRTSAASNDAAIQTGYANALAQMRADLPKKIDGVTTLTAVNYEGTKLIYENRLGIDRAKLDDAMKDKLTQSVTKSVCTTAAMRRVLEQGGSFRYVYADNEAKPWLAIDIVRCE